MRHLRRETKARLPTSGVSAATDGCQTWTRGASRSTG